jgi:hypothetical protein
MTYHLLGMNLPPLDIGSIAARALGQLMSLYVISRTYTMQGRGTMKTRGLYDTSDWQ